MYFYFIKDYFLITFGSDSMFKMISKISFVWVRNFYPLISCYTLKLYQNRLKPFVFYLCRVYLSCVFVIRKTGFNMIIYGYWYRQFILHLSTLNPLFCLPL